MTDATSATDVVALLVDPAAKGRPLDSTGFAVQATYDVSVGGSLRIPARITLASGMPYRIIRVYNKAAAFVAVTHTESAVVVTGMRPTRLRPAEIHVIDAISEPAAVIFHIRVQPVPLGA